MWGLSDSSLCMYMGASGSADLCRLLGTMSLRSTSRIERTIWARYELGLPSLVQALIYRYVLVRSEMAYLRVCNATWTFRFS